MVFDTLIMFLGQLAAAVSVFFIKESRLAAGYIAAYRLLLTVIIVLPLFLRDAKIVRSRKQEEDGSAFTTGAMLRHIFSHSFVPGIFLGLHFIFWNTGARMTLTANATLFVNMTPLFMPLVIFLLTRERPGKGEIWATLIALSGVFLLSAGDFHLGLNHLAGDIYCFVSMIFLTFYLALSRRHKALPFWYYMTGVYFFGAIVSIIPALAAGEPLLGERGWIEFLPIIGLTLISTMIGHNLINLSMRKLPSQLVGVGQLSQFLWAGILAWIIYNEAPTTIFYPSMGLIAAGTLLMLYLQTRNAKR